MVPRFHFAQSGTHRRLGHREAQRGANGHDVGGAVSAAARPRSAAAFGGPRWSSRGIERSSPSVYGCRGRS